MPNQKPANRQPARAARQTLVGLGVLIACCLLSLPIVPARPTFAQAGAGAIVGTERLFVRRGPGTEFPPFATLTKGDTVEVQETQGEWARIITAGGQTGYVRSNLLVPRGEHEKVAAPSPALVTPTAKPQPAAPAEPPALRAANARNKTLETELRMLQQQIAELKSRSPIPPPSVTPAVAATVPATPPTATLVPAPAAGTEQMNAEIARLTAVVETLQRRLETRPPIEGLPAPVAPIEPPHALSSGALALGIVGVAIGWLAGSILGRKPDRGRRPRLRF